MATVENTISNIKQISTSSIKLGNIQRGSISKAFERIARIARDD
jgi:hypothetical protein